MSTPSKQIYEFGPFRIDREEKVLLRDGKPVPIPPKAFEVLLILVESSGHIVEKDQLLNRVWADTFVEEGNLKVTVSMLRKALEESAGEHQFIETVPRRGYRFVAGVRELPDEGPELMLLERSRTDITIEEENPGREQDRLSITNRSASSAEHFIRLIKRHKTAVMIALALLTIAIAAIAYLKRGAEPIASMAVMPFVNLNADPNAEYLSDGITESIINSLAQLPNLKVIARSSVFRYKGKQTDPIAAANELGVRAVLTGRVMQRGEDVIVSVELIDARDNKQLWGERYERKLTDLLSVQRDIAQEISGNLRLKLSGVEQSRATRQHTENAEAYQLYLQGRYEWYKQTEDGLKKAIGYFEQAVGKDPNYALAHVGLADSYWALADASFSMLEAIPKAKDEATKALQLDDSLAEAHTSLAVIKLNFEFDWTGAENEFRRAIKLNPNYVEAHHQYAWLLSQSGRPAQGLEEMKRAQRIDPLNLVIDVDINAPLYDQRRFDLSTEQSRKVIALDPSFFLAHYTLGFVSLQLRDFSTAIAELEKARSLEDKPWIVGTLAYGYALSGNRTAALKLIAELHEQAKHRHVTPFWFAMTSMALGDKDEAFKWLEQCYAERSFWLTFLKMDPMLDPLRDDPLFKDLLKRLHFPE